MHALDSSDAFAGHLFGGGERNGPDLYTVIFPDLTTSLFAVSGASFFDAPE